MKGEVAPRHSPGIYRRGASSKKLITPIKKKSSYISLQNIETNPQLSGLVHNILSSWYIKWFAVPFWMSRWCPYYCHNAHKLICFYTTCPQIEPITPARGVQEPGFTFTLLLCKRHPNQRAGSGIHPNQGVSSDIHPNQRAGSGIHPNQVVSLGICKPLHATLVACL